MKKTFILLDGNIGTQRTIGGGFCLQRVCSSMASESRLNTCWVITSLTQESQSWEKPCQSLIGTCTLIYLKIGSTRRWKEIYISVMHPGGYERLRRRHFEHWVREGRANQTFLKSNCSIIPWQLEFSKNQNFLNTTFSCVWNHWQLAHNHQLSTKNMKSTSER